MIKAMITTTTINDNDLQPQTNASPTFPTSIFSKLL